MGGLVYYLGHGASAWHTECSQLYQISTLSVTIGEQLPQRGGADSRAGSEWKRLSRKAGTPPIWKPFFHTHSILTK